MQRRSLLKLIAFTPCAWVGVSLPAPLAVAPVTAAPAVAGSIVVSGIGLVEFTMPITVGEPLSAVLSRARAQAAVRGWWLRSHSALFDVAPVGTSGRALRSCTCHDEEFVANDKDEFWVPVGQALVTDGQHLVV